jgi:hypothetical protein
VSGGRPPRCPDMIPLRFRKVLPDLEPCQDQKWRVASTPPTEVSTNYAHKRTFLRKSPWRDAVGVVTALPAWLESTRSRVARKWERSFQRPLLRRLISRAIPGIRSTARAIWSRQRAITAGRHGSIVLSGTGPTSWDALSQRSDASGSPRPRAAE